jgi:Zn-dependent peptidase ImmA (M78 family)
MAVCRMDLADAGSPEKLVTEILKAEPDLPCNVPLEALCQALDILRIEEFDSENFEGGLITDAERSAGIILVKKGMRQRQRFTIAHELGHFLIPRHMPNRPDRFLCTKQDLMQFSAKDGDRRQIMEMEANRFAALLLVPPPLLRRELKQCSDPDIGHVPRLARVFNVSKEVIARAYTQYHDEKIAIVVTCNGVILRFHKNVLQFPFMQPKIGGPVPRGSSYHSGPKELNIPSLKVECAAEHWLDVPRGQRAPPLFEQVYWQQNGFALIMLHLIEPDEDDEFEEAEIARNWQVGFPGRSRRR